MITPEQQSYLEFRRNTAPAHPDFDVCVFSGDVYMRPFYDPHAVTVVDPDGRIRYSEGWPTRGVSLAEMEASDRAIQRVIGK